MFAGKTYDQSNAGQEKPGQKGIFSAGTRPRKNGMGEVGQEWASVESSLLAGRLGGDAGDGGKETDGYLGSLGWLMGVQNQGQNEVQGPMNRTPERVIGSRSGGNTGGERERDGGTF